MTLAQVWKSPHIAEPDAESHTGEDVLGFVVPLGSVLGLFLFLPLQLLVVWDPQVQSWVRKNPPHDVHTRARAKLLHWLSLRFCFKLSLRCLS